MRTTIHVLMMNIQMTNIPIVMMTIVVMTFTCTMMIVILIVESNYNLCSHTDNASLELYNVL